MKWVVYLLALLNLLFFAWQYRIQPPAGSGIQPQRLAQVGRLLLLSEVDPERLAPVVRPRSPSTPPEEVRNRMTPGRVSEGPRSGPPEAEPVRMGQLTPAVEPAAAEPGSRSAVENQLAASLSPHSESPPPPAPPDGARSRARCYRTGPVEDVGILASIQSWLRARGAEVNDWVDTERIPRSYWVYLPPYPSRDAAREVLGQLKALGLKDYMRVMRGPQVNAISLGLYNQRPSAEKRLAALNRLGLEARIDVRYEEQVRHRLDAIFRGPSAPDARSLDAAFPAAQWRSLTCSEVLTEP